MTDLADLAVRRKLLVEFLGTFALTYFGVGAVVGTEGGNLVAIALANGLAVGVMIAALGDLAEGYFNPAVTIGLLAGGRLDPLSTMRYVIAQVLGAVGGALLLRAIYPSAVLDEAGFGIPTINKTMTAGSDAFSLSSINALIAEAAGTFFLTLVILGVGREKRLNRMIGGIAIAFTIAIGVFAFGEVSGASMNPARYLGAALVHSTADNLWVWIVGPIGGAILASLLFTCVLFPEPSGE
jgi:MIP family channel proteins